MPTGGVSRENAADWIRAGAVAIGAGSALVDAKAIAARQFDAITANAQAFVTAVQGARSPSAKATGDR
jgi:2-dehydro-3-deoxyphosphogluconate aldolase / (4S)-4-hydroxy-2-oxoglutarate aldolase